MFTYQNPMKHVDVSMPILKVHFGQDLETELQKRSPCNPSRASKTLYLLSDPLVLLGYYELNTVGPLVNVHPCFARSKARVHTLNYCLNTRFPFFVCVALRAACFEINDFPLCLCCPAGGLDFEKSCFLYLYNFLDIASGQLPIECVLEERGGREGGRSE